MGRLDTMDLESRPFRRRARPVAPEPRLGRTSRLTAPGRNVGQVYANGGATPANSDSS
jgi:hypothetical protein